MRLRIAVTDNDWFRFLRSLPGVDEVNFWMPGGGQTFKALDPGEPLLFKLHSPENYIVGGGFFVRFLFLPWSFVWEAFGQKNGTATQEEMRQRIEKYRRARIGPTIRSAASCSETHSSSTSRSGSHRRRTSRSTSSRGRATTRRRRPDGACGTR